MIVRLARSSTAAALLVASAALSTTALAQKNPVSKSQDTQAAADARAMQSYRLTPAVLAKLVKVQDNMLAMVKANPSLAKKYASETEGEGEGDDEGGQPQTIQEMAQRFDKVPEMKQVIAKSGLTTREYLLASFALMQASMASAVMEMPGADRSQLPPAVLANAAFLKTRKAELDHMAKLNVEMQKLTRPAEENAEMEEKPDTTGGGR